MAFTPLTIIGSCQLSPELIVVSSLVSVSCLTDYIINPKINDKEYRFKLLEETKYVNFVPPVLVGGTKIVDYLESKVKHLNFLCLINSKINHYAVTLSEMIVNEGNSFVLSLNGDETIISLGCNDVLKFYRYMDTYKAEKVLCTLILIDGSKENNFL